MYDYPRNLTSIASRFNEIHEDLQEKLAEELSNFEVLIDKLESAFEKMEDKLLEINNEEDEDESDQDEGSY